MALDPGHAGEARRNDRELVMPPAGCGAGVSGVTLRVIDHFHRLGRERAEAAFDLFYRAQFGPLSSTNLDSTTACATTKASISPVLPNILKFTHASVEKLYAT